MCSWHELLESKGPQELIYGNNHVQRSAPPKERAGVNINYTRFHACLHIVAAASHALLVENAAIGHCTIKIRPDCIVRAVVDERGHKIIHHKNMGL